MKTSIRNFLALSLIMACVPVMAAPAKKTTTPIATPEQKELNKLLIKAIWTRNTKQVKELLAQGADANASYWRGLFHYSERDANMPETTTPLIEATRKGYTEICKLLIDSGANLNTVTLTYQSDWGDVERSRNALMIAANNGNIEICKLLIKHGAKINIATTDIDGSYGKTHTAISLAKNEATRKLLTRASWIPYIKTITIGLGVTSAIAYGAYKLYRHVTKSARDRIGDALRSNQNLLAAILRPGNGYENARKLGELLADRQINALINNQLLRPNGHRIGEQMTQEFISIINDPQFANNIEQEAFVANIRQQMLQRFEELS